MQDWQAHPALGGHGSPEAGAGELGHQSGSHCDKFLT